MPMAEFNLVSESWLPCVVRSTTRTERSVLSLSDLFAHAHEIEQLVGDTPLVTVALHRLLLSILHRCFGPANAAEWQELWRKESFDADCCTEYLDKWRSRFDLFDEERPFYQTAGLDFAKAGSMAKLLHQDDNNPTLFDHHVTSRPPLIGSDHAARLLVSCQAFDPTGTKTADRGQESAKAAPLVKCAVALTHGNNLFETLLLNLHRYAPDQGEPWDFRPERDCPGWEGDEPTTSGDRMPNGYLDLLTWQSRRIRLEPVRGSSGSLVVQRVVLMKGNQFPVDFERRGKETMVAFCKRPKAPTGQDPWPPLGFHEDRALWRDSMALVEQAEVQYARPKMLSWLSELGESGLLSAVLPLHLYGVAVSKAKYLFWRHEYMPLPAEFLSNPDLIGCVRTALLLAEQVGRTLGEGFVAVETEGGERKLPSAMRVIAESLLGANGEISELVRHHAPRRRFWSGLEQPFWQFLEDLPSDAVTDEFGQPVYGTVVLRRWVVMLQDKANTAFQDTVRNLGTDAKVLRAAARGERALRFQVRALLGTYLPETHSAGETK